MTDEIHEIAAKPTGLARFFPGMDAPPSLLRLVEHGPTVILMAATLGVLWFTLFPFQLLPMDGRSIGDLANSFRAALPNHPFSKTLVDIVQNILLFVPVGFGAAGIMHRRRNGWLPVLLAAMVYSAILTLTVESIQTRLPGRIPSLIDVVSNTAGGLLGGACFRLFGSILLMRLVPLKYGDRYGRISPVKVAVWGMVWVLLAMLGIFLIRNARILQPWNAMYHLGVGNEFRTDRSWNGTVSQVTLFPGSSDQEDAHHLLIEGAIPASDHLLYDLSADAAEYADLSGTGPALIRNDAREGHPWLQSAKPISGVINQIREKDAFTFLVAFESHEQMQGGYARIATVSYDGFNRNLTVAQFEENLVIRIRLGADDMNGAKPELIIPDVFRDLKPRQLLVSYYENHLDVWLDNETTHYQLFFHPAADLFWMLFPRDLWQLTLTQPIIWLHVLSMYVIIFAPLGVLGMLITSLLPMRWQSLSLIGWIVIPTLLIQLTVLVTRPHPGIWADALAGVLLTYLAMMFTGMRLRSWHRARNLYLYQLRNQASAAPEEAIVDDIIDEAR